MLPIEKAFLIDVGVKYKELTEMRAFDKRSPKEFFVQNRAVEVGRLVLEYLPVIIEQDPHDPELKIIRTEGILITREVLNEMIAAFNNLLMKNKLLTQGIENLTGGKVSIQVTSEKSKNKNKNKAN